MNKMNGLEKMSNEELREFLVGIHEKYYIELKKGIGITKSILGKLFCFL